MEYGTIIMVDKFVYLAEWTTPKGLNKNANRKTIGKIELTYKLT